MAEAAIQAVVDKLVDYLVDVLKDQVSYLCCYSCNIQTLADEVGELTIKHGSVQQDVDAARANLGVIRPEVVSWLAKAEEVLSKSKDILGDPADVQRSCMWRKWFLVLHYSLSKKASKIAKRSLELRNTSFVSVSNPLMPAEIAPVPSLASTLSDVGFQSRDIIEDKIMDALKVASVYPIGIWGIGGVGKTTMAKKIEERVRAEKSTSQHVVMVVVSQKPDLQKIQIQIAEGLGLTLIEESPVYRARKLHQRLMIEKDILIILDDLWEMLDLKELGIPSRSTHVGCKLILTSRNRDTLTSTGVPVENIFQLEVLTEEESWIFFRYNLNEGINVDLIQIARKVERECKGLPLALKVGSSALRGRDKSFWDNTVRELEKSVPENIPDVIRLVYRPLLYSIKALEGKAPKDLFLMCCLFPEDYVISIEELIRCGIGLRIFTGLENLTVVRDKLETILKNLVSRSLLIQEDRGNFCVRMHDVIRDVGIWTASEGGMVESNNEKHHLFMISHGVNEWPKALMEEDSSNNYTCISLIFSDHRIIFPESIFFPKLKLLHLNLVSTISRYYYTELLENFFNGMNGLRVLEASWIRLLPSSIGQLNNLRTLSLRECNISKTASMMGKLINLEILSLTDCEIKELSMEIGGLEKLKHMSVVGCTGPKRIAFGVVSRLVRLEELIIMGSFVEWEAKAGGKGGGGGGGGGIDDMACLSELDVLKNLTTLMIQISDPRVVPSQKPPWVQNLKRYHIAVSNTIYMSDNYVGFQKSIFLGCDLLLGDWIYDMASDAEYLHLNGSNFKRIVAAKGFESFSFLKRLDLSY